MLNTITFKTVIDGQETVADIIESNDRKADAAYARHLRDTTGMEVRVYDEYGLRGIMDAKA